MKKDGKNPSQNETQLPEQDNWDEYACIQGCKRYELRYQEMLYKKFYQQMRMMINRYTKDFDEGTTILNNGFLRVFNKIHLYKYPGHLEAWIKRIIIHAVSDHYRYHQKETYVALDTLVNDPGATGPELQYDYHLLLKTFDILPKTTRLVVNLYIIEEFSHKEIAQMLNMSEGTSKWHLSEGRKLLTNHLNQYHPYGKKSY